MATNWKKAPLTDYSAHFIKEGEVGFNYYGFVHPSGQVIVMREEITTKDILYADGGFNLTNALTDRVSLDYKELSKI